MVKEFRDFLMRGNVVDLAVAVVIGAAFSAVVNSLVADIITPLLSVLGIPDFSTWVVTVGSAELRPGLFLNALISFVVVAAAIFLLVVKPMNAATRRFVTKEEAAPAGPTEVELLTQIRDELAKRA